MPSTKISPTSLTCIILVIINQIDSRYAITGELLQGISRTKLFIIIYNFYDVCDILTSVGPALLQLPLSQTGSLAARAIKQVTLQQELSPLKASNRLISPAGHSIS